jgi:Tetratricopeptide repeat
MQIHGKEEQDRAISAFTTWEISFQQFTCSRPQTTQEVGHFLTLSAFLDPSHIGESIFRYHWEEAAARPAWMRIFAATGETASDEKSSSGKDVGVEDDDADHVNLDDLEQRAWDGERFWDLITKAHTLSLLESISSDSSERGVNFSLHPLIRDWLQLREKAEQRRGYTQEAIDFVVSAIRVYETISTTYFQKGLLAAHADACVLNNERFSAGTQALGRDIANCDAASWLARFYQDQGRYGISEKLESLSLKIRETVLGKEHPDTLTSMNNLALVLWNQDRLEETSRLEIRVLETRMKLLGSAHPDTLTSMVNLAYTRKSQG